ncbi:MAG TPA: hypothetical protein VFV81_04835 [Verrucomicrobiae bacterium]|nr:hypothetical protein [Verrucomicrobiae bacterium]
MKKILLGTLILTVAAAGIQTARAGDHEWAVVGKIATGAAVAGIVAGAVDHVSFDIRYGGPPVCVPPPPATVYVPVPPPVVYAPAPVPVICAPPVVVAPLPPRVVVCRQPVVVYRHPLVVRRVIWRAHW